MLLLKFVAACVYMPLTLGHFLTGTYAPPTDMTGHTSLVRMGFQDTSDILNAYLKHNQTNGTSSIAGIEAVTFSLGMFSSKDCHATRLQYHYTAPQIQLSKNGTRKVDADSIYRAASVTKLMTVLTGLLEMNQTVWDTPVSELVPAFAPSGNESQSPHWNQITPRHLASHQAGVQRTGPLMDYFALGVALASPNMSIEQDAAKLGVPAMNVSEFGGCFSEGCTRDQFIRSVRWAPVVFLPATNPSYSNFGMMVLGLVISEMTGKSFDQLYRVGLFDKVGMNSSFANAPVHGLEYDRAVVAGPVEGSYIFPENNPTLPSGGILTSINDLNKLGIAILNSTLMTPLETREWMKPLSHTSSLSYSIGAPWEIIRFVHNGTGKVTDMYTKLGDSGAYGGMLAIIPEYQAGFSFLNAFYEPPTVTNPTRGESALKIINHLAIHIIPALEAQAALEAQRRYVGTYTDPSTNSSIEIAFNQSDTTYPKDGLTITKWYSRGVDVLNGQFGQKPRLLPSIIDDDKRPVFQATSNPQYPSFEAGGEGPFTGFYATNLDFAAYEGYRWFGGSFSTFEFELGEHGRAVSVVNGATRAVMSKVQD